MWQLWAKACLIGTMMYNRVQSEGYTELLTIRVCSIEFTGNDALNGMFDGFYHRTDDAEYTFNGSESYTFSWSVQDDYRFVGVDGTYGEVILKLGEEQQQEELFEMLYLNNNCDCEGFAYVEHGTWRLENLNEFGNPIVRLCSSWGDFGTIQEPGVLTNPADAWGCNRECGELSTAVAAKYQGFEVFSDLNCESRRRRRDGLWKCRAGDGCKDGFHAFKIQGVGAPSGQGQFKCVECKEYFGTHCAKCERQIGCQQCDNTDGYGIIRSTRDCQWQYCGLECCEEDGPLNGGENSTNYPTPAPSLSPTAAPSVTNECEEGGPVGGGTGSTDYDCRSHRDRLKLNNGIYGERYVLPDPITQPVNGCNITQLNECLGDCENGVPYQCPGVDPHCLKAPIDGCNDDQPFDLRGCRICECSEEDPRHDNATLGCTGPETEYFWFSNAVPCVHCADIKNCTKCRNGGPYGRSGCAQCESGFHGAYDEDFGVIYCEANDPVSGPTSPPSPFPEPGDDNWTGLICPDTCGSAERFGENDYCFCGCDCNVCTEADIFGSDAHCADCEYHDGCAECENNNEDSTEDYFMIDKYHRCENCADVFGTRCSYCNDFFGCAQCEPGYLHTLSDCCVDSDERGMWYCVLAPTNE